MFGENKNSANINTHTCCVERAVTRIYTISCDYQTGIFLHVPLYNF